MTNFAQIIAIIDQSGSMYELTEATIQGFNQFLESQSELDGEASITTVLFNDEVDVLTRDAPLRSIRLTQSNYHPCGSTALYDAIGQTLLDALQDQIKRNKRPDKTIVVILTDGAENASTLFNNPLITRLIAQTKTNLDWTFLFFGANIDVVEEASKVGLEATSAFCFEASSAGVRKAYSDIHETIASQRGV